MTIVLEVMWWSGVVVVCDVVALALLAGGALLYQRGYRRGIEDGRRVER